MKIVSHVSDSLHNLNAISIHKIPTAFKRHKMRHLQTKISIINNNNTINCLNDKIVSFSTLYD